MSPQVLSQEEVDSLLRGIAGGDEDEDWTVDLDEPEPDAPKTIGEAFQGQSPERLTHDGQGGKTGDFDALGNQLNGEDWVFWFWVVWPGGKITLNKILKAGLGELGGYFYPTTCSLKMDRPVLAIFKPLPIPPDQKGEPATCPTCGRPASDGL